MIKAKLIIDEKEINVLWFTFGFNQGADATGRPSEMPIFIRLQLIIETRKDLNLADWSFVPNQAKQLELHIYPVILGARTRTLYFYDCHLVNWINNFSSTGNQPMSETLHITSAGVKDSNSTAEYSAKWRVTYPKKHMQATTNPQEPTPTITKADWMHPKTKEVLEETTYAENVTLSTKIENPSGNAINVIITKKDNTEFEQGKKQLSFSETLNEDGTFELTALEIKEKWLDFKEAYIDELIAKVTHSGVVKKSKPLQIVPPPQVLVSFRPNNNWKGEFGFDWIRKDDTNLFKDEKFEDIISKQYTDNTFGTLETDSNKYEGNFKKNELEFKRLKEKYKPIEIKWRKVTDANGNQVNDKHYTEWLSLKKGKEAKVKIHIDVSERADYLQFDDDKNFTITPNKLNIKNKTGTKKLNVVITIKCDKEFANDQEIIIKAYKKGQKKGILAGKINVWANDTSKHKKKKVVFVQITTKLSRTSRVNTPNASSEKARINKYLEQAYIELHPDSVIVDLDLRSDIDFSRFVKNGKIQEVGNAVPRVPAIPATVFNAAKPAKLAIPSESITTYLKNKLKDLDVKYDSSDFFKAFYFAENGYHPDGNLSGFSAANADYVVVFKSANDQTASHEFLHSFNLTHTFANVEASTNAEFTYKAKMTDNLLDYSHSPGNNNNRCSLYYWQWIKANNSI